MFLQYNNSMETNIKIGDLVIMPGETLSKVSGKHSVGLVIEDFDPRTHMWAGSSCIDYEPTEWLEVIF